MKLKVISLNMWSGGRLFPQLLEFITAENPDIISLQEVYNASDSNLADNYRSMEVLHDKLDYEFSDFAPSFIQDLPVGKIPQGNAILSRYPINHRASYFLMEGDRESYPDTPEMWPIIPSVLQHVELETAVGPINIFNMHGVWDLDGDNPSDTRQKMVDITLEKTAGKPLAFLMGDTNAKPTNPAMKRIEKQLQPVFGDSLRSTFNMRRKDNPGYATAAVDLMYVSSDVQALSASSPNVDISDHLPVVATFEV